MGDETVDPNALVLCFAYVSKVMITGLIPAQVAQLTML
jgi:hypothetical protein